MEPYAGGSLTASGGLAFCEDHDVSGPGVVFDHIRALRATRHVTHGPLPGSLSEALPNKRFWFEENGRIIEFEFSKVVVIGHVIGVTNGPAFAHGTDDELRSVNFNDATAAERAIDVRVRVDEFFDRRGRREPPPSRETFFRWGGLGRLDGPGLSAYITAIAGMGRIVAVLNTRSDRDGEVCIPVLQGGLLGQVNDLDKLTFPGLGDDEIAFMGKIQTLAALRHAADADQSSTRWEGPSIN